MRQEQTTAGAGAGDVLAGSAWMCWSCPPDAVVDPSDLATDDELWIPAMVPGTVAATLRARDEWRWGDADQEILDGHDWWYRCRFDAPGGTPGPWQIEFGGLATVADAWLNGDHLLHSENMWLSHSVRVGAVEAHNVLLLRFAALDPLLARRRPRPRWRSLLLRSQNQRWFRTTMLGRIPGWAPSGAAVGPWRPVCLHRVSSGPSVSHRHLVARCEGDDGVVDVRLVLDGVVDGAEVELQVGGRRATATVSRQADDHVVEASIRVPGVERWWPHTHGDQPRYPVGVLIDAAEIDLGTVGFRTVGVDRDDGGFTVSVNEVPLFCRGACWVPPDVVTLGGEAEPVRASLQRVVDAGMNMVRVSGFMAYESDAFWDGCDELGVLVWQDCMLASYDPPDEPEFVESLNAELNQQLGRLQGRPALALVCGSSESQQQAAMFGLSPDRWQTKLLDETIPELVDGLLPGAPYVVSTPTGGDLPFDPSVGVAHYFGVGAYLRPVSDARTTGVRFAAECLAFATPPEPTTVERTLDTSRRAGHHPAWKAGVPRDGGASWDFEDVRDDYVRRVFGVDPLRIRYADPDRALDYGRAVVAHLMATVMGEWRCQRSSCDGALILTWQDLCPGAGWGLLDASGIPKAPWYALRPVLAPLALLITDDGLSGLRIHVINDRPTPCRGTLRLCLFDASGTLVEDASTTVEVRGRSQGQWSDAFLLDGFRDLTNAYRFGPPAYDVVRVSLDVDGVTREAFHLPSGPARPQEVDLGLEAAAHLSGEVWELTVRTRRFAQWIAFDLPDFVPSDSWFHLAPNTERTVTLRGLTEDGPPRGRVRALNSLHSFPIAVDR
jgi:beta-mannosidase